MTTTTKTCEFAERPGSRLNPGLCGAPATHTVFSAYAEPFPCCEKHFHAMIDSPPLTPTKRKEILDEFRAQVEADEK